MADDFGPLVGADWLAAHLADVRVVDVRWYLDPTRSGRAEYERGHLPGAVWLDIDTDLSEPASPADGRHPLPSAQRFADCLGRAGIAEGTPVVAYDDSGGSTAARLWWLLHVLGEPAALLDGGLQAWTGELVTSEPEIEPVRRVPRPWPAQRFRSADELAEAAHLIDARSEQRFKDGDPAVDPQPGHIPGAVSLPWQGNLDENGRLRPVAELRARYAGVADAPIVAYCGSGVSACLDLLALTVVGVEDLALYPGSFSQWGADPARSVERG